MAILAALLIFFVVIAVAALAVGVGSNFDNQQALQSAADMGALAGAQETGTAPKTVMADTQTLVWQNLDGSAPPGTCPTEVGPPGSTCTESGGGYTVTVTYPYEPINPTVNNYTPSSVVAVDITHDNPQTGFAGFLGFHAVNIHVHAAAVGTTGTHPFPFALATRFLDLTGGGSVSAYGSVLVYQCSDSGKGDFTDHGYNGGLYFNGGTGLLLGGAYTSKTSGRYSNAEAVLVASPTGSCPGGANSSATAGLSGLTEKVDFSPADPNYNFFYGFNSGPAGCNQLPGGSSCQTNPEGGSPYAWQDQSCWQSGTGTAPVAWTKSYAYPSTSGPGVTIHASTTTVPCPNPNPATYSNEPYGTMEGSYNAANFPNFPQYATPEELVQELEVPGNPTVPTPGPLGTITASYAAGATGTFSKSGADWTFPAGVYVVNGASALPTVKGNFNCVSDGSGSPTYPNGCVFILMNGASVQIQGTSASLNCSYAIPGDAGCSFYLADSTTPTSSVFSISNLANGELSPIPFCAPAASTSTTCTPSNFPVVYSNGTSTTGPTNSLNGSAVVSLANPGNFAFNGTIYVPHGIFSSNANAGSSSGQVIADSVRLQGGSNGSSGVAYDGSAVAPPLGAARLIE